MYHARINNHSRTIGSRQFEDRLPFGLPWRITGAIDLAICVALVRGFGILEKRLLFNEFFEVEFSMKMVQIIWNSSDHGFLGVVKVALLMLKKSLPSLAIIVEMELLHVYFSDLFLHVCYQKFTKRTMNVNWWKIQSCHVCLTWTARTYWNMLAAWGNERPTI